MDVPIEPNFFDIIVVGTGLPESIVAGAAAVAGKKVLHLDAAEFYGSHWASLSFDTLNQWAASGGQLPPPPMPASQETPAAGSQNGAIHREGYGGENGVAEINSTGNGIGSADENGNSSIDNEEDQRENASLLPEAIPNNLEVSPIASPLHNRSLYSNVSLYAFAGSLESSRSYTLDLAGPRLAFCAGPMVDLLIRSGCHNYLEFKALEGSYLWQGGTLAAVPSSRADIFQASMSLSEKRVVSRFFKKVTDYIATRAEHAEAEPVAGSAPASDLGLEDAHAPFVELLRRQQLPQSIREFVLYAIALVAEDQEEGEEGAELVSTLEGLQRMTRYLTSIGRFGGAQSAFLYPMYGQGELPQAFCRIAAVKGALYVLRRPVDGILVDKGRGPSLNLYPASAELTGKVLKVRLLCHYPSRRKLDKESKECKGVRTANGQLLYADKLVLGPGFLPTSPPPPRAGGQSGEGMRAPDLAHAPEGSAERRSGPAEAVGTTRARQVARCLCITEGSVREGKATVLVVFPPKALDGPNPRAIRCLQVGFSSAVAPRDRFVVQLSTPCPDGQPAEALLRPAVEALFTPAEPPVQPQEAEPAGAQPEAATSAASQGSDDPQRPATEGAAEREAPAPAAAAGAGPPREHPRGEAREASGGVTAVHRGGPPPGLSGEGADQSSPATPPGASSSPGGGSPGSGPLLADAPGGGSSGVGVEQPQQQQQPQPRGAGKPRLLWCVYYNQAAASGGRQPGSSEELPAGASACGMPDETVDYRSVVAAAEEAFGALVPGEPFFPQAAPAAHEDESREGENGHVADEEEAQLLAEAYGAAANGAASSTSEAASTDAGSNGGLGMGIDPGRGGSASSLNSGANVDAADNNDPGDVASLSHEGVGARAGHVVMARDEVGSEEPARSA